MKWNEGYFTETFNRVYQRIKVLSPLDPNSPQSINYYKHTLSSYMFRLLPTVMADVWNLMWFATFCLCSANDFLNTQMCTWITLHQERKRCITWDLRIHPIYSHQTQTLLWMPRSECWQKPDSSLLRGSARAWQIQWLMFSANHWTGHRVPSGGVREKTDWRRWRVCNPIRRTTISINQISLPTKFPRD